MFGLELDEDIEWDEGRPVCEECGVLMNPFTNPLNQASEWVCGECGWSFSDE